MPLIHGKQKEREHDDNHAERGGTVAGRASEQKEKRYSDECRRSETYKLPLVSPNSTLDFTFVKSFGMVTYANLSSLLNALRTGS